MEEMPDETISTETPPLSNELRASGGAGAHPHDGQSGPSRAPHGALKVRHRRDRIVDHDHWDQDTHQYFLTMVRSQWRGWHIVLFEDRGAPHTAEESRALAAALHIEIRLLPVATPALNAMDHLWRHVKGWGLANRATVSIDTSADIACQYLLDLSPRERLRKAGVLSGHFWLTL